MADRRNWQAISDSVVGTTISVPDIAERFGVDEDDVEHELGLVRVQTCPVCGWWSHTWHPDGVCEECDDEDGAS